MLFLKSSAKLCAIVATAMLVFCTWAAEAGDVIYDSHGFENTVFGEAPPGWQPFHADSSPDVTVVPGDSKGTNRCLRGQRSRSGGWTSLARPFQTAQDRVLVEFSFAFSAGPGRTLNIWTHEPGGTDASQLNLCIQNHSLLQFDGRTRTWELIAKELQPTLDVKQPQWHRLRVLIDARQPGVDYWIAEPGNGSFPDDPITRHAYRTGLPIGALDLVSGQRIAPGGWYLIDDLVVYGGEDLPSPGAVEPLAEPVMLWTGPPLPADPAKLPLASGVHHQTIHDARSDPFKFLHGAAIVEHNSVIYTNWANSPRHENGPLETMRGRRSHDGGKTWSAAEMIAPGFPGPERHSHGILFVHNDQIWTIAARFGVGEPGRRFPGLKGEAFVLDPHQDRWISRGVVMQNCWPYDQPVPTADGNLITGGQDKDGLPVVAISQGSDLTQWDTVAIPFAPGLKPSYAETTVWAEENDVFAVIRGGGGVAWMAASEDGGRSWSRAQASNFPMPRAKAYLGKLSTGQWYLLSNYRDRDTLVVSVGKPGARTLSRMFRVRDGKSGPPRFEGHAKSKQWSYPYGYELDGRLFIVYSVGKEDCGLSIVPIESLAF